MKEFFDILNGIPNERLAAYICCFLMALLVIVEGIIQVIITLLKKLNGKL